MEKIIASTYEIIRQIGSGGGGNIYLANHLRLGKKVILKADKRKIDTKQELLRREVDVLKNLSHPNIPQVYDFFIENNTVYTVMEYIEGESLDKPLKRGEKFSQAQVIKWAKQLLKALSYLHSPIHGDPPHGFVHSDIKPANIMRTPFNDICLIDFNIALALGEDNVIGRSAGYSSPEHYGLDYSEVDDETVKLDTNVTETLVTQTLTLPEYPSRSSVKKIAPDVRSDIYSVGATLYHLLSGIRPAKDAKDVIPLTDMEINPQVAQIITKAMNPNPNLRYQTADDMLHDFCVLHENDERMISLKRQQKISMIIIAVCLALGLSTTFVGLKRMQTVESWLKLSEYSQTSLKNGDTNKALNQALKALPSRNIFTPQYLPQAQKSLTDALNIYDLSDGYKQEQVVKLASNPLCMEISPDGQTAACIYLKNLVVLDTNDAKIIKTLPAQDSALAEVEYLNNDTIVYAGSEGLTAYSISKDKQLWEGLPATSISVSDNGRVIAGIYKEKNYAVIYDSKTGKKIKTVKFGAKKQKVTVNDTFVNPHDNLFELNQDGSLLGVSFSDGSLMIYNLKNENDDIELFDNQSGFTHFEGGFYKEDFAFSATNASNSTFAVIDTVNKQQLGGFNSGSYYSVRTDNKGIYVHTKNILVKIDPITGKQTPLVTTTKSLDSFATQGKNTVATSSDSIMFFDEKSNLMDEYEDSLGYDFAELSNGVVLLGSQNSPNIRIMRYNNNSKNDVLKYDASYKHDEVRISADKKTVMLFSYKGFQVYDVKGNLINEVTIPDAKQVYDQQFRRKGNKSYLEVIYNDGTIIHYDAKDGSFISKENKAKPDLSLDEEFNTDTYKIESPLHGPPKVYDKKSNKLVCKLKEDGYLTYITQLNGCILTQYVTTNNEYYGILLNEKCEEIAYLPNLTDVYDNEFYFDYPTGIVRKSKLYNLDELIKMAHEKAKGEQ